MANFQLTSEEFRAMRIALSLTQGQVAQLMDVGEHTVYQWERVGGKSDRAPNPTACKLMWYFSQGFRPPDWPRADEIVELQVSRTSTKAKKLVVDALESLSEATKALEDTLEALSLVSET